MDQSNEQKKAAALEAAKEIRDGMILGLGTGSTVYYLLPEVGRMIREGASLKAMATSEGTRKLADQYRIPMISPKESVRPDLAIDGVDAVNDRFQSVKGGGGALFREKIIASHARRVIWIMDESKLVSDLSRTILPVEALPFGWQYAAEEIKKLGFQIFPRIRNGSFFVTDSGNYILDLQADSSMDYQEAAARLKLITGVLETGFFDSICEQIIVGRGHTVERRRNTFMEP